MSDLNDEVRARIERDDSLRLIDRHLEIEAELRDSPALRYFMFCIEEEKRVLVEKFAKTPPTDINRISYLQALAQALEMIPQWLDRLRSEAKTAEEQILVSDGRLTPDY
jgi:hypothetical protein